jgi:hypothetical protein
MDHILVVCPRTLELHLQFGCCGLGICSCVVNVSLHSHVCPVGAPLDSSNLGLTAWCCAAWVHEQERPAGEAAPAGAGGLGESHIWSLRPLKGQVGDMVRSWGSGGESMK